MKKDKILLLGDTFLTKDLTKALKKATIYKRKAEYSIKSLKPDVVIADRGIDKILKYLKKDTFLVYLSSDEIYDGKSKHMFNSEPNPITEFGKETLKEENTIAKKHPNSLILRLPYIITTSDFELMLESIKRKKSYDSRIKHTPIFSYDLGSFLNTAISTRYTLALNIRGKDETTVYDMMMNLAKYKGVTVKNIGSSTNANESRPARIIMGGVVFDRNIKQIFIELLKIRGLARG